jgi:hypothetical protein
MFENLAIAVAVITGLTQVVKKAGVRTKYIPLVAVLFGIIYGLAIIGLETEAVVNGIIAGLTSVGMFRLVQKTIE